MHGKTERKVNLNFDSFNEEMFKILCSDVIEFPTDFKTQMPEAQLTSLRDFGFLQNKGSLRISLMFHVPNQG